MAEMKPTDPGNADAPFGYNDDGSVLAPYGLRADGKPRTTNRGRRTGGTGVTSTTKKATTAKKTQAQENQERKSALLQLTDLFVVTPLAAASTSTLLAKKMGEKHTDALAGDAVIVSYYMPSLADGLIAHSEKHPGTLAWMDGIEEKTAILMMLKVGIDMTKAIAGNHMEPNADVAKAGRRLARMNVFKMAAAINAEAEALGVPSDEEIAAAMRNDNAAA